MPGASRQLVDIGVHAALGSADSPSVEFDAPWHLGAVFHEMLRCELPGRTARFQGDKRLVLAGPLDHARLIGDSVDRLWLVIVRHPAITLELVRALRDVRDEAAALDRRSTVDVRGRQLDRCLEQCRRADILSVDLERIEAARHGRDGRRSTWSEA